ncbi:hypothetical protein [Salmonella enterica]|uniref:Uncharacterized protein n=1 Tax=Salmonella enterica subsp. enterica serovar Agona TaxID=58095 RepID=A0A5Y0FB31_SALET|nr:hypothetical protein [Salmonella enterica]EEY7349914.1 hypothetical protein [Escherichia coli]HCK7284186.1 hypothetical protein [Enterobacter roggenkampii]EAY2121122.1 hypothetical protein [Salmonella enterica]EBG8170556.1 hypothetical protein [Salmonella enterica subsp. enterica serovar Agona]EBW3914737.1 hypothetical protein [Salmonella enterica subsp. enterica serovar Agona]
MDDKHLKDTNGSVLLSNSCVDDEISVLCIPEGIAYSKSLIAYNPTGEALQTQLLTGWMERSCNEH